MAEITVIVPVYKVEKYIHKCVDSILGQTFRDLEVILVDDGSPDRCGEICEEYSKKDSRVMSVHKENGGLSDARNYGLQYASGKYVIFIDSDDYMETDMLEYLHHNLVEHQVDMATCGAYDVFSDRTEQKEIVPDFVCSGREAFGHILRGNYIRGEIWNKLIKTELIKDLRFPKGKLYEDIFYTAKMMQKIEKVCVGTVPKYYYLHRSGSITGKGYRSQLQDIIEAYEKNYQIVCKHFPELKEIAECLKIWSRFIVLDKLLLEKDYKKYPEYKKLKSYLMKHLGRIMKNHYFHPFRKLAGVVLCINVPAYHQLVLISIRKQSKIKG